MEADLLYYSTRGNERVNEPNCSGDSSPSRYFPAAPLRPRVGGLLRCPRRVDDLQLRRHRPPQQAVMADRMGGRASRRPLLRRRDSRYYPSWEGDGRIMFWKLFFRRSSSRLPSRARQLLSSRCRLITATTKRTNCFPSSRPRSLSLAWTTTTTPTTTSLLIVLPNSNNCHQQLHLLRPVTFLYLVLGPSIRWLHRRHRHHRSIWSRHRHI
jgi:hypothetical protein